jgi:hypothetical protein
MVSSLGFARRRLPTRRAYQLSPDRGRVAVNESWYEGCGPDPALASELRLLTEATTSALILPLLPLAGEGRDEGGCSSKHQLSG